MRPLFLAAAAGMTLMSLPSREAPAAPPGALPAIVRVHLPPDSTLTVDGQATTQTSATRWFVTPPLRHGRDFHYTFRAGFPRGSQTVTVTERVAVRAGRETVVYFGPSQPGAWISERGSAAEAPQGSASPSFSIAPASYQDTPALRPSPAPALQPRPAWEPAPVQMYNEDDYPRRGGPPGARRGVGQG